MIQHANSARGRVLRASYTENLSGLENKFMNNDEDGIWVRMHLDEDHPLAEIGNAIIEMAYANVRELKNMTEKKQRRPHLLGGL